MSTKLTRVVSALTSIATLLSLSGAAYLAPLTASAAVPSDYGLKEGNTISASGTNDPDIYIVNAYGYKRLFLNPIIFSFYGHLGGFAAVKSVSAVARDAFPTTQLFRNCETNDQAVWAVEVTGEDTATLHHVVMSGDAAVAQDANFFKKVFCVNNNEANWYTKGSDYTSLSQIPPYVRTPGATPTPTNTGAVSVSLASDNPASGTLVQGQAAADLAHFMFTGSGVITNLKFNRLGVSADADLANVYLYDGVKRLTDAATVANGMISFNDTSSTGLFTVNGSRTISVRSDLSSSTSETVGVQLTSFNGNATSISGNLFTVANATLGTVVLANSATPSTNAALDPASDTVVFQDTATIGTRYAWLKSLQVRVIGSVYVGDLRNFRLFIDGVQQGAAVAQTDANGYVVFDSTANPIRLETGGRVIKILADVVNGSSRNFSVSIRQAADLFAVDSQYGQPIKATVNATSFPDAAGTQTISSGTLTVTKTSDSPSGDTVKGASGVTLARFQLKANGESMKVESLRANFTYAPLGVTAAGAAVTLRNGALFVDGVQVGSTASLCASGDQTCSGYTAAASTSYTQYNLGSSLVVVPGTPRILEIRGDIFDDKGSNQIASTDLITANVAVGSTNVQALTSLGYSSVPAVAQAGNALTVKTGTLTVAKYTGYANQSIVSPKNGVKLGHFTVTAASAEDVNLNTVSFDATYVANFAASKLTDVYIKVWNDTGSNIYTSPTKATISSTASNSYSVNFVLPKNKTYQVEVWGNVATGATNTAILNLDVAGVTTGSSTSTTSTAAGVAGQTITIQSGSITVANGSIPAARLAKGGDTVNAYSFTIQPAYDDFTLDEVYVDIASGSAGVAAASSSGAVANLLLKDANGNLISSATLNSVGSASFTGLNRLLAQASGTQTYKIDVQLANVGVGANDTGGVVKVRLDGYKYHSSSGTVTTTLGLAPATYTGNNIVDYASYPIVTNQALSSSLLTTGNRDVFQTQIKSAAGTVVLKKLNFSITTTGSPVIGTTSANNLTNGTYKLYEDGTDISSLTTIATASADLHVAGAHTGAVAFTFSNDRPIDTNGHVYRLNVNVTATGTTPQSIVTALVNNSSTPVTDSASNVAGTLSTSSASIVWSDSSAVSHTSSTGDWTNDYLIQTINSSQALTM